MPGLLRKSRRPERYLVCALNHSRFENWCRQHGINPYSIKYVGQASDLEGNHDHHVVLLHDYHRNPLFMDDGYAMIRILQESFTTHYEWDIPTVENGRIVGWQ